MAPITQATGDIRGLTASLRRRLAVAEPADPCGSTRSRAKGQVEALIAFLHDEPRAHELLAGTTPAATDPRTAPLVRDLRDLAVAALAGSLAPTATPVRRLALGHGVLGYVLGTVSACRSTGLGPGDAARIACDHLDAFRSYG